LLPRHPSVTEAELAPPATPSEAALKRIDSELATTTNSPSSRTRHSLTEDEIGESSGENWVTFLGDTKALSFLIGFIVVLHYILGIALGFMMSANSVEIGMLVSNIWCNSIVIFCILNLMKDCDDEYYIKSELAILAFTTLATGGIIYAIRYLGYPGLAIFVKSFGIVTCFAASTLYPLYCSKYQSLLGFLEFDKLNEAPTRPSPSRSPQEIAFSYSLEAQLKDEEFRIGYMNFLKREFNLDSLKFVLAVDSFKQGWEELNSMQRIAAASSVYKRFVAVGSPYEVNLSGSIRSELERIFSSLVEAKEESEMCKAITPVMFDKARKEIMRLLEGDSYKRYCISVPQYSPTSISTGMTEF
jgi:hypothetical protein